MEIVSKSFILPAAVSGVMFPAFARSFAAAPAALARCSCDRSNWSHSASSRVRGGGDLRPANHVAMDRHRIRRPKLRGSANLGGRRVRHRPRMDTARAAAWRASTRPVRENSSGGFSALCTDAVDRCCEVRVDRRGLHLERAVVDRESDDLRDGDPVCCGIGTRNRRGWRIFSASHWGDYGRGIPSGCS